MYKAAKKEKVNYTLFEVNGADNQNSILKRLTYQINFQLSRSIFIRVAHSTSVLKSTQHLILVTLFNRPWGAGERLRCGMCCSLPRFQLFKPLNHCSPTGNVICSSDFSTKCMS